jgi:hypothetical protein
VTTAEEGGVGGSGAGWTNFTNVIFFSWPTINPEPKVRVASRTSKGAAGGGGVIVVTGGASITSMRVRYDVVSINPKGIPLVVSTTVIFELGMYAVNVAAI